MKQWLAVLLIFLLAASSTVFIASYYLGGRSGEDFYLGISFCGDTFMEAKLLIDRIKNYTNLFVVQSGPASENETALNEICDYAVGSRLNIIVFFGDLTPRFLEEKGLLWRLSWLNTTRQRWGDQFLGVYYYDEPGGIQVDCNWTQYNIPHWNATYDQPAYDEVANLFKLNFQADNGFEIAKNASPSLFVSDYALYWFDYLLGYDVVLAQVGWNHSLIQDIALVRGAARLQGKSWGVIVTWKYNMAPYLDDGEATYRQMCTAYKAGAKYVVLFNYPNIEGNSYGAMKNEHFEALERLWNEVVHKPAVVHGGIKAVNALVLPRNYGWGMRHPEDKIWGLWGPDEKSPKIWSISRQLLEQYGTSLDIVYADPAFPLESMYKQIYYWNQTIDSD